MVKIAPSLLSADFTKLAEEIKKLEKAGADILHLDVMDGHFVPNLTFGPPVIKQIKKITNLPLDVHLMANNPEFYLPELADMGIEYVSFHQEIVKHIHRQIYVLKEAGVKAGIALNPATPVETLSPVLEDLDFVLIMSVNPGFGGQSFLPLVYSKIKKIRKLNSKLDIEVDGGVNSQNAPKLIKAGCTILVAGSYILRNFDYSMQIKSLRF
ncbi:MAG: ribulose-phosphate 3-epimerase [Candidatus Cloacimonadota bacterium]|nr:ribulose-phosphate 3-epimerase [Candidatus Cloacimonadota bacterium]